MKSMENIEIAMFYSRCGRLSKVSAGADFFCLPLYSPRTPLLADSPYSKQNLLKTKTIFYQKYNTALHLQERFSVGLVLVFILFVTIFISLII